LEIEKERGEKFVKGMDLKHDKTREFLFFFERIIFPFQEMNAIHIRSHCKSLFPAVPLH